MKKFAAFDLDGTLFRTNLSRNLMVGLINQGVLDKKLLDELDPYYYSWKNREHPDAFYEYDSQHIALFNKYIKGVPFSEVQRVVEELIEKIYKKTYVYTRDLAKKLGDDGYFLIAITASPYEIAQPFALKHNFDVVYADGIKCNKRGFCVDARTDAYDKRRILQELIDEYGLTTDGSYAIGDTASDIGMLELVDSPIAFNPSKELFTAAKERGWPVVVERKDMVFELEPGQTTHQLKHQSD